MKIYHLVRDGQTMTACELAGTGTVGPDDELVGGTEARDPAGRHFNCLACDKALHHGRAHVQPPEAP